MAREIRVALVGIGNCASSLIQGLEHYRDEDGSREAVGLMHPAIAGYLLRHIRIVAGLDVSVAKIGKPLESAIYVAPNNAAQLVSVLPPMGVVVRPGVILDGIAKALHNNFPLQETSRDEVIRTLKESGAEMLVSFLPTGSHKATRFYAQVCIDCGIAFINGIPQFIASDPEWVKKFEDAGIPCAGDDVMSQIGATFVNRAVVSFIIERGCKVISSDQSNIGGNADFENLVQKGRVVSKLISKTRGVKIDARTDNVEAVPAAYNPELGDTKLAEMIIPWFGFAGMPYKLELSYEGDDSPNCAGVMVDMIRLMRLSLDRGLCGNQRWSAWYCKHPLEHMSLVEAHRYVEDFIAGT